MSNMTDATIICDFFFWFFDLGLMITPLASSNFAIKLNPLNLISCSEYS